MKTERLRWLVRWSPETQSWWIFKGDSFVAKYERRIDAINHARGDAHDYNFKAGEQTYLTVKNKNMRTAFTRRYVNGGEYAGRARA